MVGTGVSRLGYATPHAENYDKYLSIYRFRALNSFLRLRFSICDVSFSSWKQPIIFHAYPWLFLTDVFLAVFFRSVASLESSNYVFYSAFRQASECPR